MIDFSSARERLQKGDLKLQDLTSACLEKINEINPEVNAFISVDENAVMERARQIQDKISDGTAGKLAGCITGIKDIICEKGSVTSCASHILRNFESVYDATVIERMRQEDALLIGRLNMDEFAMGSSNENTIYGPVRNPHDSSKVAGGSSGGSAAAIAADMCNITLGSDTGGSIRQPASYCGVVGLKPTYGRVSRHGLVAFASSFDGIGPFSHTVRDAAAVLSVISGYDPNDNTSSRQAVPDFEAGLESGGTMTVGVPEQYFGDGLDDDVRELIEGVLKSLENEGRIRLIPLKMPHMEYSISTYYILAAAEASSNLARYDGVRYGHRADLDEVKRELSLERQAVEKEIERAAPNEKTDLVEQLGKIDSALIRLYKRSRTEGFGQEVKRRIMLGTYVLSAGYYDAYYAKAQKVRRLIREDFDNAFSDVDLIVSPTAPTPAFELGSKVGDPVQMYLNDIYTAPANLAGICGISVPAGRHPNGMPVGIQFMADRFQEEKILQAGYMVEQLNK